MVELLIVLGIVAAAALYLAWVLYRAFRSGSGTACAGGCGCEQTGESKTDRLGRRIDLVPLGTPKQSAATEKQTTARAKQAAAQDAALTGRS